MFQISSDPLMIPFLEYPSAVILFMLAFKRSL